jgi:hypothetical protein
VPQALRRQDGAAAAAQGVGSDLADAADAHSAASLFSESNGLEQPTQRQ